MILFKNSAKTLEGVLKNQKHATNNNLQFKPGEIILIQQTISTLSYPGQKAIRWIMEYESTYLDENNESDKIWGRHWNYIIQGKNLRPVDGFNISELQVSNQDYGAAQIHAYVLTEDEFEILDWIADDDFPFDLEANDLPLEFDKNGPRDIDSIIELLNQIYAGKPNYKTRITKSITRPTALRNALVKRDGTACKICSKDGFVKRNGAKYCELHHMIELNKQAPYSLQSWNLIVVCPNCHRQLHHGKTKTEYLNPGWKITIDDKILTLI